MQEENKPNNQIVSEFQRIRMLENRMRNPTKPIPQDQSSRTIKSTDSKKVYELQLNKNSFGKYKNDDSNSQQSMRQVRIDTQVKNNKKITDYFIAKSPVSAKNNENLVMPKDQKQIKSDKPIQNQSLSNANTTQQNKQSTLKEEAYCQEIKNLKEKIKSKEDQFLSFKTSIKKQMLDLAVKNHRMKRNEMKIRVSNNRIRLGDYLVQKKGGEYWVDGVEIREIRQKIDMIVKEKEELQKNKKSYAKKSNKESAQDFEQWKNAIASQMYFLSREEAHLYEQLKRLEEQKTLHIKELKLLYDEDYSKYGRADSQTGLSSWPKIGQYQLLGLLGKGGFSEVYKAFDTQQLRQVACKLHQLNGQWDSKVKQNFIKHALRQEEVHKMLNHPNIVKLYETVEIDHNAFCTILEYCQGPDLSYYLKKHKRLPEKQAKMILRQVVNAIKYLHELSQKVIHYDLKPQNIIFHKGRIKITDFGLCKKIDSDVIELTSQGAGTYWYLPPECFAQKPQITTKVDVWSIGVIYFEMLYGQKPFGNQMSQVRVLKEGVMLKANVVNFPQGSRCTISNQSKQFIKGCLKANVDERLDIRGVSGHSLFEKK